MRLHWFLIGVLLVTPLALAQQAGPPVLFFSDLTSGPATGNSDTTYTTNGGAYVTLYGNFFGSTQGSSTITLAGASCLHVISWGTTWQWYQKIVVQLTSGCGTGNFVVTVGGQTSNALPFTVASGNIYYAASAGSDSNSGSFSSPWLTIPHAVQTTGAGSGNIVYVENGDNAVGDDGQGWNAALTLRTSWCQGTATQPDALATYPGASAQIGATTSGLFGIRGTDDTASGGSCQGNWTFSGFTVRGDQTAVELAGGGTNGGTETASNNWRLVGLDISCPCPECTSSQSSSCLHAYVADNDYIYGINAHDIGPGSPTVSTSDQYQGIYFTTDSNHIWFAWNTVSNVYGCRGIQTNSSTTGDFSGSGNNQFDIHIHDNRIHDTSCDGIVLDTIDPSKGTIEVYNNVIYNAGTGPATVEGGGDWACIYVPGETLGGHTPGSGAVQVYNNTLYNCGGFANPPYSNAIAGISLGSNDGSLSLAMQNNVIYQTNTSAPYWVNQLGNASAVSGANNLAFGIGAPPSSSSVTGTINSNPQFVGAGSNFNLSSASSPANGAGSTMTPVPSRDNNGLLRPSPPAIGAFEFAAGTGGATLPNPPTNLTVVVH